MFSQKRLVLALVVMFSASCAFGSGAATLVSHWPALDSYPAIVGSINLTNNSYIETTDGMYTAVKGNIANAFNLGWPTPNYPTVVNVGITSGTVTYVDPVSGLPHTFTKPSATGLAPVTGADYTATTGQTTFFGKSFTAAQTLTMYTWAGDSNMDGWATVEDDDLWLGGYYDGQVNPTKSDYKWIQGDYNYDGYVTIEDSDLWLASYYTQQTVPTTNYGPAGSATNAVPEPGMLVLVVAGSLAALVWRSRRRTA